MGAFSINEGDSVATFTVFDKKVDLSFYDVYGNKTLKGRDDFSSDYIHFSNKSSEQIKREIYDFVESLSEEQAKVVLYGLTREANFVLDDDVNRIDIQPKMRPSVKNGFAFACGEKVSHNTVISHLLRKANIPLSVSCAGSNCDACDNVISTLYCLSRVKNKSEGDAPKQEEEKPKQEEGKVCKAHRIVHSNMLITNCNYKPIYYTDITKYCPYCGRRLEIIDI